MAGAFQRQMGPAPAPPPLATTGPLQRPQLCGTRSDGRRSRPRLQQVRYRDPTYQTPLAPTEIPLCFSTRRKLRFMGWNPPTNLPRIHCMQSDQVRTLPDSLSVGYPAEMQSNQGYCLTSFPHRVDTTTLRLLFPYPLPNSRYTTSTQPLLPHSQPPDTPPPSRSHCLHGGPCYISGSPEVTAVRCRRLVLHHQPPGPPSRLAGWQCGWRIQCAVPKPAHSNAQPRGILYPAHTGQCGQAVMCGDPSCLVFFHCCAPVCVWNVSVVLVAKLVSYGKSQVCGGWGWRQAAAQCTDKTTALDANRLRVAHAKRAFLTSPTESLYPVAAPAVTTLASAQHNSQPHTKLYLRGGVGCRKPGRSGGTVSCQTQVGGL